VMSDPFLKWLLWSFDPPNLPNWVTTLHSCSVHCNLVPILGTHFHKMGLPKTTIMRSAVGFYNKTLMPSEIYQAIRDEHFDIGQPFLYMNCYIELHQTSYFNATNAADPEFSCLLESKNADDAVTIGSVPSFSEILPIEAQYITVSLERDDFDIEVDKASSEARPIGTKSAKRKRPHL
jgi:hypothetical protein